MKNYEIQLGYAYFEGRQAVSYRRLPADTAEEAREILEREGADTALMIITEAA